jgi:hypothetical protein
MKTEILKSGFLDSDDNARGSRITITVVCPISDVQLKIPRKLFKLPVNTLMNNWGNSITMSMRQYFQNKVSFCVFYLHSGLT